MGGQTAVAKFGLGFDIHIDGGNIELVFVQNFSGDLGVADLVGINDFDAVIALDLSHQLKLLIQVQRLVVFMKAVFGPRQKTGDNPHL